MKEFRGEKVSFGKGDYHHLDSLPSASRRDAAVLATPRRRSWFGLFGKVASVILLMVLMAIGSLFVALERGYLDSTLTARAEQAMSAALGDQFTPEVGKVRLRFSDSWMLALAAVDVKITHIKTGIVALRTDSIAAVFDPKALISGRIALARAEIGIAEGDLRFLPAGPGIDIAKLRIDGIPGWLDALYPALDGGVAALQRSSTSEIVARSLSLMLPKPTALGDRVELTGLDFSRSQAGRYVLKTAIHYGKLSPLLTLSLDAVNGRTETLNLDLANIDSEPFLLKYSRITGEARQGIDLPLSVGMTAERDRALLLRLKGGEGLFYSDGEAVNVRSGMALIAYDFRNRKLDITKGQIDLGETLLPLQGSFVDLHPAGSPEPAGIAMQLASHDAVAAVPTANEAPQRFNLDADGTFLPATRELQFDRLAVTTETGTLSGSLYARFIQPSPAIRVSARADRLTVANIKQLWPFWLGNKVRHWVLANISGGVVTNGVIDVSLEAGRIPEHPTPLVFRQGEIHIGFDAQDASVRFFKELPASKKTTGHFEMQDRDVRIAIKSGQIALPSGKTITGQDGLFEVADISKKPIMASLDITAGGEAPALAEFASFEPMNALSHLPFAAADLTGTARAKVSATFGLEKDQNPPKPVFNVALDLADVGLKKPFEDRKVANLDGTLTVDPHKAVLKAKADIDGIGFDLSVSEPLAKSDQSQRQWQIEGQISKAELAKAAPSLASYVSGSVGVDIHKSGTDGQVAKIDLTSTELSVPVVGWRKGAGVPASAEFSFSSDDGLTKLRDLKFSGEGFGANGDVTLDKRGLLSARLSRVKLATADNFGLNVTRKSAGLAVEVSGESIDLRPFMEKAKAPSGGGGSETIKTSDTVVATIGKASGFNKENLSSVILKLSTTKGQVSSINFSAVTKSGQAVVVRREGVSGTINLTAGDAGAVARFTDVYRNMTGGLLNISLKARKKDSWRGSIDIRNFALINEQRIKSIVSARAGDDGRSLSDAVSADIDTSSQKFRRGFARIMLDGKVVQVENGIVRGDQIGATFQGTVRDTKGDVDLTGTFMPAYGINSLFGQLPLIGALLGNGRDRGLLGITFKLEGPFDQPKLTVNPLSLIAPGVFRNIFEFE